MSAFRGRLHIYVLAVAALIGFPGCGLLEQDIVLPIPDPEPALAVGAVATLGDSVLRVYVDRVRSSLEPVSYQGIRGARLSLSRSGQELATTTTDNQGWSSFSQIRDLVPGDHVTLRVMADGYPEAISNIIIPASAVLQNGVYTPDGGQGEFGDVMDLITFDISDDAATEDYYVIEVLFETTYPGQSEPYQSYEYIESADPLLQEGLGSYELLLSDQAFRGRTHTVRLSFWNYGQLEQGEDQAFIVRVRKCDRDYYLFSRSVALNANASENPFAEPVVVHTNVSGGAGIFTIQSKTELRIPVD